MAHDNVIRLYDLVLESGCTISPFVWRTKYALKHKGFEIESVPSGFTGIAELTGGFSDRLPVIVDGVIACSAALVADGLAPAASGYLIGGHNGVEAGIAVALRHLRLDPVVALDLRLGEGSGAVTVLPIVRGAAAILSEMATFDSAGVSGRE